MADATVFSVKTADFETAVLKKSETTPVVVDFWAPWCGPCKALAPLLERLVAQRNGEVLLAKVNTDEEPQLASQYGIQNLPTVVAFQKGQPTIHFMGRYPEAQIIAFLDQLIPTEADKQLQKAIDLEKTDPAQAEAIYREILTKEPKQETAAIGLARLLIPQDKDAEAAELLDRISIGAQQTTEIDRLAIWMELRKVPEDIRPEAELRKIVEKDAKDAQSRFELGYRLAAAGKYPEALEMLLDAGEKNMKLASGKVRETMVKIFEIVGQASPLANDYRKKLSTLLY